MLAFCFLSGTLSSGVTGGSHGGLLSNTYAKSVNFISKTLYPFAKLSVGKRGGTLLKKTMCAGILTFRGKNKFSTLYKVRKAIRTVNDDETQDVWLGTSSNKASSVRPKFVSDKVTLNVLCVVNKCELPVGVDIEVSTVDLDKTEPLLNEFFFKDGDLIDDEVKVIVRLPACAPAPYGFSLKTGTVDQGLFDGLDMIDDTYLTFWAISLNDHNEALQQKLLGESTLKKYLPPRPATGHGYTDSPFFKFEDPDEDDELLNPAVEELRLECEMIAKVDLTKSIQDELSSSKSHSSGSLASKPTDEIMSITAKKPAAVPTPTFTSDDHVNARLIALGMTFDNSSGNLTLPVANDLFAMIRSAGSIQSMRDAVRSTFGTLEDQLSQSSHFLYRLLEFPDLSKIGSSYLAQCIWSADSIESLDLTTSNGFISNMIMPDNAAISKAKADAADIDVAEEAMGEHYSKKSKLDTSFKSIQEITGINVFLATMANMLLTLHMYYTFVLVSSTPKPSMAFFIEKFAMRMTERQSRIWLKKNRTEGIKLMYYCMSQIFSIQSCFARASKDVLVLNAILKKEFDTVPKSYYKLAFDIYDDSIRVLDRVFLGSHEVPSSSLWRSSPAKQRLEDKDRKSLIGLLTPRTNPKDIARERRESLKNEQPPTKIPKGECSGFIATKMANLFIPKGVFPEGKQLCRSGARVDSNCPYGDKCHSNHDTFVDMNRAQQKRIVKWIDNDKKVNFSGVSEELLKELRAEMAAGNMD